MEPGGEDLQAQPAELGKVPYDDEEYRDWHQQFSHLVTEFLKVEGNTEQSLKNELDEAVKEAQAE